MSDLHSRRDEARDAENESGHVSDQEDLARRMHERQLRPASIDIALNLERELDDEHEHDGEQHQFHVSTSIEASDSQDSEHRNPQSSDIPGSETNDNDNNDLNKSRRVSFDPQVLQHIITNLRTELAKVQSERDALAETLAAAPTREAELREALNLVTERCAVVEAELENLKRKNQEDEESIQMLRTKLEESRRALMRLQTESKRMSHMSVDTGRANSLFGGAPSSSKRASFTPLTGSGANFNAGAGATRMSYSHRRVSSISEPSDASDIGMEPSSPTGAGQSVSWPAESEANVKKARRSSAFFGGMPMSLGLARSATPSPPQQSRQLAAENDLNHVDQNTVHELETLRKERDSIRVLLASARQELAEAQEAREASEQCVVALRAFISSQTSDETPFGIGNNGANGILKLPPLPTEKNVDEFAATPHKKAGRPALGGSGWSFGKLFRAESGGSSSSSTGSASASVVSPPAAEGKSPSLNGNATADASTPTKATSSNSPSPSTATPGGAFSRTFGGFFNGKAASITSIGSVASPDANAKSRPVRPPTAHGQQEPTMNGLGSDDEDDVDAEGNPSLNDSLESRSSTTGPPEPASPDVSRASEVSEDIWIRNASSAGSSVHAKDGLPSDLKDLDKEKEVSKGEEAMVPISLQ